ncbi:MAG: hypothetical protein Ct9H300mP23_09720 [Nitrospinota bacterium]|nr:MAG: hypothetical protein Ct9H300mP23_09720 [Nitrospinota bacterium]
MLGQRVDAKRNQGQKNRQCYRVDQLFFIWRVNLFVVAWAESYFRIQKKSPPEEGTKSIKPTKTRIFGGLGSKLPYGMEMSNQTREAVEYLVKPRTYKL